MVPVVRNILHVSAGGSLGAESSSSSSAQFPTYLFREEMNRFSSPTLAILAGKSTMGRNLISRMSDWFGTSVIETWNWFNSLNSQEWFLLLGIVATLGFLCMRGFGSRGRI